MRLGSSIRHAHAPKGFPPEQSYSAENPGSDNWLQCDFLALVAGASECFRICLTRLEGNMKKIALAMVLVVAGLSLGGCFVGKGKAPAPVVTKG